MRVRFFLPFDIGVLPFFLLVNLIGAIMYAQEIAPEIKFVNWMRLKNQ